MTSSARSSGRFLDNGASASAEKRCFVPVSLAALLIWGLFASASATAQSDLPLAAAPVSGPKPIVTRFRDWEQVCEPPVDLQATGSPPSVAPKRKACKVMQRLAVQDTGETVFLVSVLPAAKAGGLAAILSTPLGGYLVPGMELRVDDRRPLRVLFETCNSAGCHGGFSFSGAVRNELLGGRRLLVRLWTAKSKPVDVAVSLDGLNQAVKALEGAQSQ